MFRDIFSKFMSHIFACVAWCSIDYTSLRSRKALTKLIVSAYSIYPEESPLESRVSFTLCLSFRFCISSCRNVEVASHSRFGLQAMIISSFVSEF